MTPSSLLLRELTARWAAARPGERANAQSNVINLCQALGVEPPRPASSGYEFESPQFSSYSQERANLHTP